VVSEVLCELEAMIVRSKLAVQVKVSPDLPKIHSDRQKVKQIMVNLISNALKFTHQGSIRVAVRYPRQGRLVSVAVTDTGIGIPESDFEKVFEDFRQLDNSPSRGHGGTGLGLSISKRLAVMLQGKITLDSRVGGGSTFTLYLPRRSKERR
jgi:signal transduction histidine kinase